MKSLNPLWKLRLFVHSKFAFQDLSIGELCRLTAWVARSAEFQLLSGRSRIPNLIPSYSGAANDVAAVILVSFLFIGPDTAIFACFLYGARGVSLRFSHSARGWGEVVSGIKAPAWDEITPSLAPPFVSLEELWGVSFYSTVKMNIACRGRRTVSVAPWCGRLINGLFIIIFYGSFLTHFFFLLLDTSLLSFPLLRHRLEILATNSWLMLVKFRLWL